MDSLSKKTILVIILVAFLGLSFASTTYATDWFYAIKEFGVDLAARAIARAAFQNLSQALLEQVQGKGRDGGPAFVQNWRNFQTDAQYRGEDIFRALLASTKLCGYIDNNIKDVFNAKTQIPLAGINTRVGSLESFGLRMNCTLPQDFDLKKYQQDFAGNGGWDALARLSEPQNNYYGALLGSLSELQKQVETEVSSDVNEALANDGFISVRKGRAPNDSCQGRGANAKCVVMGNVVTPGKLLGETVANTIDQDLNWIATSDEISEVMIAVISATVNRLTNLAESKITGGADPKIEKEQSLKEEYCTAKFPSDEALQKYGKTKGFESRYDRAKVKKSGWKSPCEAVRDKYGADNPYPYQRCIIACFKAVGAIPASIEVPDVTPEVTPADPPDPGSPAPTETPNPTTTSGPTPSSSLPPAPTNLFEDVKAERSKYPAESLNDTEVGKLLNAVAWKYRDRWGLLEKTGGSRCPHPSGKMISCDTLIYAPQGSGTPSYQTLHFDVLIDVHGAGGVGKATPTWQNQGPCALGPTSGCEMSRFLSPVQP